LRHFLAALFWVALVQAAPGRQDRALAIRFNRSTFECPVDACMLGGREYVANDQIADAIRE